ncbi:MAG: Hsp20 family protein [Candidatus Thiodiazotropha taylori]|uniref:Hsp20 family protein n=1 Tax=Candidatus Thiodiazotropha taylori TaxID=2792791 RepID=A0A9E4K9J3_9GAMM|nr:Hsp20 family protein [Candidatus Thiodiazotropha taylori]MCW4255105.1 Hsp20 family protein [Candidatus Thiodiazotropha taylori]
MTRFKTFNPYFVGFDRLFNDMETFAGIDKPYPPHNLVKKDVDGSEYALELAVAGFKEEDISVEVKDGTLIIEGKGSSDEYTYLHKGISTKNFRREFKLSEKMVVESAEMVNGLLVISMYEEIPEEKKSRKIEIGASKPSFLKGA